METLAAFGAASSLISRPTVYVDYVKVFTRIGVKRDWLGDQQDKPDGTGLVSVDVTVHNATGVVVETDLRLDVVAHTFDDDTVHSRIRRVVIQPGVTTHKLASTIADARLWWTWDLGRPDMYTATISMSEDTIRQVFGIKEVVHDDATGQWFLNGQRVFLRGMRYISSQWLAEANAAMWQNDLAKMLDMDINAIRIGSHVEPDGFYTLCDELGLLVWQVFPLHYCVSDSDDLIERASEMIMDMGMMLCNHASIGMWSVFKEPEIYLLPDKPNNYHRLCRVLKETLGTVDPTRWIHLGDYREGVQNLMIGYCWDGDTDLAAVMLEPNIVEFGAGSIPVRETLETLLPADKLWPPDWDNWEYHGFFHNLATRYAKIPIPYMLDELIETYQAYEALVVKEQIEYLRQRKYSPIASMYLYYWSDSCPIMGSGLFDYYRRPYAVYESMRRVYTRVLISLELARTPYVIGGPKVYEPASDLRATVWVTNDHHRTIEDARVSWRIVDVETGKAVATHSLVATLASDSAEPIDQISWPIPATASPGAIASRCWYATGRKAPFRRMLRRSPFDEVQPGGSSRASRSPASRAEVEPVRPPASPGRRSVRGTAASPDRPRRPRAGPANRRGVARDGDARARPGSAAGSRPQSAPRPRWPLEVGLDLPVRADVPGEHDPAGRFVGEHPPHRHSLPSTPRS